MPHSGSQPGNNGQKLGFTYVNEAAVSRAKPGIASEGNLQIMPLSQMRAGERVRVVRVDCDDANPRLVGMGLTPGTILQVKRHAPLGDPTEIEVRGFALSLRKGEAAALQVVPVEGEANLGSDGQ